MCICGSLNVICELYSTNKCTFTINAAQYWQRGKQRTPYVLATDEMGGFVTPLVSKRAFTPLIRLLRNTDVSWDQCCQAVFNI